MPIVGEMVVMVGMEEMEKRESQDHKALKVPWDPLVHGVLPPPRPSSLPAMEGEPASSCGGNQRALIPQEPKWCIMD